MRRRSCAILLLGAAWLVSVAGPSAAKPPYPVLGYLPTWSHGIDLATVPWNRLTHVIEAFGLPDSNGGIQLDPRPGLRLAGHATGTRVFLGLGGATIPNATWASAMSAANRAAFLDRIVELLTTPDGDGQTYDGIDIDWEFPDPDSRDAFMALMAELHDLLKNPDNPRYPGPAFDGQPRGLTFFISPGFYLCGVDWAAIAGLVDYGILSGHDYMAGVVPRFNGPIDGPETFTNCFGWTKGLNVRGTLETLTGSGEEQLGFPMQQLLLSLPLYVVDRLPWEVREVLLAEAPLEFELPQGETRYSDHSKVTDALAFCHKMRWALQQGIQGFALWEITQAYPLDAHPELGEIWRTVGGVSACWEPPIFTDGFESGDLSRWSVFPPGMLSSSPSPPSDRAQNARRRDPAKMSTR